MFDHLQVCKTTVSRPRADIHSLGYSCVFAFALVQTILENVGGVHRYITRRHLPSNHYSFIKRKKSSSERALTPLPVKFKSRQKRGNPVD